MIASDNVNRTNNIFENQLSSTFGFKNYLIPEKKLNNIIELFDIENGEYSCDELSEHKERCVTPSPLNMQGKQLKRK